MRPRAGSGCRRGGRPAGSQGRDAPTVAPGPRQVDQRGVSHTRGPARRGASASSRLRVHRTLPSREKPPGTRQPAPATTTTSAKAGRRRSAAGTPRRITQFLQSRRRMRGRPIKRTLRARTVTGHNPLQRVRRPHPRSRYLVSRSHSRFQRRRIARGQPCRRRRYGCGGGGTTRRCALRPDRHSRALDRSARLEGSAPSGGAETAGGRVNPVTACRLVNSRC